MRIIVNADDCGYSKEVDDVIEECIKRGVITSTSIMANGEDLLTAKRFFDSYPQISYGVHLVLDQGPSLTKSKELMDAGIVDPYGFFVRNGYKNAKFTTSLKKAVLEEWSTQIQRIIDMGIDVSHMDSHHHIHVYNKDYIDIVKILSCKYNLTKIRTIDWMPLNLKTRMTRKKNSTQKVKRGNIIKQTFRLELLDKFFNLIRKYLIYRKIRYYFVSTDLFMSASQLIENINLLGGNLGNSTIEVMCHPGYIPCNDETSKLGEIPSDLLLNFNQFGED